VQVGAAIADQLAFAQQLEKQVCIIAAQPALELFVDERRAQCATDGSKSLLTRRCGKRLRAERR
jgi:hypothetical protein